MHDYAIGDRVYVEMTGIYHKTDYKKKSEVFTNGTVEVQQGQVYECINIRPLKPHFGE